MNTTDRAFIAAYQQSAPGAAGAVAQTAAEAKPHFGPAEERRRKAPLAAYLTSRRKPAAVAAGMWSSEPLNPGVELASFVWPAMVDRLAGECETLLIDTIQRISGEQPSPDPVALCAAAPGAGATTLTLALARTASRAGLSAAIVDAVGGANGLAAMLGIRRAATESITSAVAIDTAVIASRLDDASLLIAADITADAIADTLARLRQTHDLVLIDAGIADAAYRWIGPAAAVLVERFAAPNDYRREGATRLLQTDSKPLLGVIETFTPAA